MCLVGRTAGQIVVIQRLVVGFVVIPGIIYIIVEPRGAGIDTPFGIKAHDRLPALGPFGGDHDDTVGTARTVEGGGRRVLQDGQRFDIRRVEHVQISRVRHAVNHIERSHAGRNRRESADENRRCRGGITRRTGYLHTGCGTGQSLCDVRNLALGNIFGFHDGGRARKSLFGRRTERHDDHVVDRLCVFFQRHCDIGLPSNRDGFRIIPDERNDQFSVCRGCKRKGAVRTCRGTDIPALDHDCGSSHRSTGGIGNCTGNLPVLGGYV